MAAAKLGFEIYALTTIPERADVGDGPGRERGKSETPPKSLRRREGQREVISGLKGYCREHVKGKSKGASEERARPRPNPFGEGRATEQLLMGSRVITVSKLMTCERKYAFEPCCMLFASLIRGLLCIIRCRRHFVFYHGVGLFKRPAY